MSKVKLVVIGNGMVGHHFLEQVAASAQGKDFQVTVVGEEHHFDDLDAIRATAKHASTGVVVGDYQCLWWPSIPQHAQRNRLV